MGEFVSTIGNPWLATEFNVTRQGEFFVKYGAARAEQFAEVARKANALLQPQQARTYVYTRKLIGGGGVVGAGSSGNGPPT